MRNIVEQLKAIDLKSIDLQGIDKKRAGTAAATLAIALGTGYYMQSNQSDGLVTPDVPIALVQTASVLPVASSVAEPADPVAEQSTPVADAPAQAPAVEPAEEVAAQAPLRAADPLSPPSDPSDVIEIAALGDATPDVVPALTEPEPANNCTPSLAASPGDMAMINIVVTAPCHADAEVDFSHAGLRFTERLNGNGSGSFAVPALMKDAKIVARLSDGSFTEVDVVVPDATLYRRAALVWEGATGLQLHAFEEGASYGEAGHLWADVPGGSERVIQGQGGYVTMLGSVSRGYAADVYTYPATMMRSMSGPDISIEAQVLETTCADPVHGLFLRANGSSTPIEMDVSIAAPGCDAVGEYLVLQGLPQDLKIALN